MGCGMVSVLFALACVLSAIGGASVDLGLTKELEEVVNRDSFVLTLKHIKPRKRSKSVVETLFAVDFPGAEHKFLVLLDRKLKRVIVETLEDGKKRSQHFTVDILHDEASIQSLILSVNQTKPGAHATLYLDCVSYGMVALPMTLRDMFNSMKRPKLEVFHERKYPVNIDAHRDLRMVLSRNECPLPLDTDSHTDLEHFFKDDMLDNNLRDDPNIQAQEPQRGDIPLVSNPSDMGVIEALNRLIDVVNLEVKRCEDTRRILDHLRNLIENCEGCKASSLHYQPPTCRTNPPACHPLAPCMDTPEGPRCSSCPRGYTGNGYQCDQVETCDTRPCFPGVECREHSRGTYCGPCPTGYEGDGRHCNRVNPCLQNPCAPGEHCAPLDRPPYFQCVGCPLGTSGNGTNCRDVDECDLARPCDELVQCRNLNPGYECDPCPPGYRGDAVRGVGIDEAFRKRQVCEDIDECYEERNRCYGTCENTPGSYICHECGGGYVLDQEGRCVPPGDCRSGHGCDRNAECHNLGYGRYSCVCRTGFAGNGEVCAPDSDLDKWPDIQLPCSDTYCKKDNCPSTPNSGQENADGDDLGDACDPDPDNDGVIGTDNCPLHPNVDQMDSENSGRGDTVGDICDNCPYVVNPDQSDIDKDGIGDACDEDMDDDGIRNEDDNCPRHANYDQRDRDRDGIGDVCDNCPNKYNPDQRDANQNGVGDACDGQRDTDKDGRPDHIDNCVNIPNSDQRDTDGDRIGDACDSDIDGDGIINIKDNCVYIPNSDQLDSDGDGRGDACDDNLDGDSAPDKSDPCPENAYIYKTDFSTYETIILDPIGDSQIDPKWEIYNNGAEIVQTENSDPGLAVGQDKFTGVDYEGTFFVDTDTDDDYVGFIFSYQNNRRFYTVMWKKNVQTYWRAHPFRAFAEPGIQLKVVDSRTGPGEVLRNALWHTGNTTGEVKLLWKDPRNVGWKEKTSYRWILMHRPSIGLIRLKIFEGDRAVADSGNIFDDTLKGGRLGVFCFSQQQIIWSDLVYRCNEKIKQEIFNELPYHLRGNVTVDDVGSYGVSSSILH